MGCEQCSLNIYGKSLEFSLTHTQLQAGIRDTNFFPIWRDYALHRRGSYFRCRMQRSRPVLIRIGAIVDLCSLMIGTRTSADPGPGS
jgi:hypothetical protein